MIQAPTHWVIAAPNGDRWARRSFGDATRVAEEFQDDNRECIVVEEPCEQGHCPWCCPPECLICAAEIDFRPWHLN